MPQHILMPALSPDMTEGRVARWLKSEGDAVRAGEVIAEIETDKATLELEATAAGILGKLLVPAGGGPVPVRSPIAVLLADGESASSLPPEAAIGVGAPASSPAPARPGGDGAAEASGPRGRIFATPIARRLARDHGLDLASVRGSGPNARILKDDVLGALASGSAPAAPAPAPPPAPMREGTTAVPHSMMRRVIARRLVEAKHAVPHYYVTIDVDLGAALMLREQFNALVAPGLKLSVNDLAVKAVALALCKVPAANATWTEEAILRFDSADVAVAVSTESGLVTPVIRGADRKTVRAISEEVKELAARARAGKLRPDEYQGGTFTVSNLGMYGVREFAAIINPPQSGILALGMAEQRAVVRDGAVVIRTLQTCTLSADHRTIDGAVGAELLAAFKSIVEAPLQLFL